jgi:type III restriction enzyme
MPDPDYGHYDSDILNYGYIFTNLNDIEIQEDIAKDYITVQTSRRRGDYFALKLPSCHSKRHREKTRLSPLFMKILLKEAEAYGLAKKLEHKSKGLSMKFISDYKAESVDELVGQKITGDKGIKMTGFDLQKYYDYFVRKNLSPFHPEDRSIGRLKEAIYYYFDQELGIKYEDDQEKIVEMVLSEENIQHFINVIDQAKTKYLDHVSKREKELDYDDSWDVPESINYSSSYSQIDHKLKSIMQPFFCNETSAIERAFINYLEEKHRIHWWFKNGDRDAVYLAVPYQDNGDKKPFYVDFIVQMKDGSTGLFDTKSGLTRQVAGTKIDGINDYIKEQNKKGKKLFGGIVTNTDPRNYTGRWIYFNKSGKELSKNNDNWENLVL